MQALRIVINVIHINSVRSTCYELNSAIKFSIPAIKIKTYTYLAFNEYLQISITITKGTRCNYYHFCSFCLFCFILTTSFKEFIRFSQSLFYTLYVVDARWDILHIVLKKIQITVAFTFSGIFKHFITISSSSIWQESRNLFTLTIQSIVVLTPKLTQQTKQLKLDFTYIFDFLHIGL